MGKISNVWFLRSSDMEKFANFVWRISLVFFGIKFVMTIVASILFIYAFTEPGMETHKFTGLSASASELMTSVTLVLQLVAVRFVLEVSLRLVGERKPMPPLPNEPLTP